MKKTLLFSLLLLALALLMTGAAAETITYTGAEAMTVGATFTVTHDCGNPNAVCTVTKAATCKTDGVGSCFCDECGEAYANWTVTIASNASFHTNIQREVGIAATCTKDGHYSERCHDCAKLVNLEVETIPAKGHDWIDDDESDLHVYKTPTCEAEGAGYYTCRRCTDVNQVVVPKDPTNHTDIQREVGIAATCTKDGHYSERCHGCAKLVNLEVETIPAKGHDWIDDDESDLHVYREPTCAADGGAYYTCRRCTDVNQVVLPATGHKFSEWTTSKEPTCTEPGLETQSCTVCNETNGRTLAPQHELKYDLWDEWGQGKCDYPEYTFVYCLHCSYSYIDEGEYVEGYHTALTTKEETPCVGLSCKRVFCMECGYEGYDPDYTPVEGPGHQWVTTALTEATCSTTGAEKQQCSVCEEEQELTLDIVPDAHVDNDPEGSWTPGPQPTCHEPGYNYRECDLCGAVTATQTLMPLAEPSDRRNTTVCCTEKWFSYTLCSDCGIALNVEEHEPLGHDYVIVPEVLPTETAPGNTPGVYCSRCMAPEYWYGYPLKTELVDGKVVTSNFVALYENGATVYTLLNSDNVNALTGETVRLDGRSNADEGQFPIVYLTDDSGNDGYSSLYVRLSDRNDGTYDIVMCMNEERQVVSTITSNSLSSESGSAGYIDAAGNIYYGYDDASYGGTILGYNPGNLPNNCVPNSVDFDLEAYLDYFYANMDPEDAERQTGMTPEELRASIDPAKCVIGQVGTTSARGGYVTPAVLITGDSYFTVCDYCGYPNSQDIPLDGLFRRTSFCTNKYCELNLE